MNKSSEAFEKAYKNLNAEQKKAVDTIEGPVMVIAGPGTGKTTILTLRIATILQKTDTPPSGILAITYTEAGVKAMRMKLRALIGSRADEVRIHTFHGFASSVISEFDEHFPHLSQSTQISDIEAEDMVREILEDQRFSDLRPIGEPEFYVGKIIGAISDAKREAWTSEKIRTFAKEEIDRVTHDEASLSTRGPTKGKLKAEALTRIKKCERTLVFANVFEAYETTKRSNKKIDFDDLIIELLVALKNDELLLRMLQEKFLYILVDEHQDTNDAQNLLIRMIADFFESPNIFVVGDEKQAVYRFQGASVANFLMFQTIWKNMEVIYLKSNYRSHQHILDASYSLIENNYAEGQHDKLRVKLLASGKETARPIDIIIAGNTEASEKYMAESIRTLLNLNSEKTIAVIVRTNRDVEQALDALKRHDIPVSSLRGADVFSHPAGKLFFDLIRYLVGPAEIESLAKTLIHGLWGVSFENSIKLVRDIRAGILKDIPILIPVLKDVTASALKMDALEYILYAADVSGFVHLIISDPLAVEVWRSIAALSEELIRKGKDHSMSAHELMKQLLTYATSANKRSIKINVGANDAQVQVTTVHSSKGLEFDYVFMPYSVEESWPMKAHASYFIMPREKESGEEVKDARRLFYVGLTRARTHISVLLSKEESNGKQLTPLRFIEELSGAFTNQIEVPAISEHILNSHAEREYTSREKELIEYTKRILYERGLSVTALNHFIKCPSLFLYKSILRLPEAPHASSEKGNAVHQAISNVWKLRDRNDSAILQTLSSSVETYFNVVSPLRLFEKRIILKSLLSDMPTVATCLKEHFALSGEVSTETWMEKTLESITIHGKLDTVIDQEKRVLVFDYKTKEGMSEKEIRGETKNANGDYFRQLVFYKILLQSNPRFQEKEIIPALVFVRPDSKGKCPIVQLSITKQDEEKVLTEIQTLVDSVMTGKVVRSRCQDADCEYCVTNYFLEADQ